MDKQIIIAVNNAFSALASLANRHNEEYSIDEYEFEMKRREAVTLLKEAGFPEEVWGHFYDLCGCIGY